MDDKHRDNKIKIVDSNRNRVDFPRKDHREEYAAEVAPPIETSGRSVDEDDATGLSAGRTAGYVGLVMGIASLFMWSVILGPIATVVGYYAYSKGSKTTGAWSMGLGILATLSYFILIPFSR